MSVRRLADDSFQPGRFAFSEANAKWADATIHKYPEGRQQSAVIPLLMRAQDQDGWVTKAAIEHIADMLAMPLIRVLEVATFYTQFQLKPVGTRAHVQVCGTTPCMLRGAEDIKAVCRAKIHPEPFHRNAEGTMSWEEVECLGACVNAPMVMIFEDTYEDLTPDSFEAMLDLFESGRGSEVRPGPQNGRHESVPIGGLTSLTGDYDDVAGEVPKDTSGGPADGSTPQGGGAGKAVSTPPSNAGYPNTYAEETDPALSSAGKAANGNADSTDEHAKSDELVDRAHRPASGATGGAREGMTDAARKDAAEAGQKSADAPAADISTSGRRREKDASADDAVIQDSHRVDDSAGPQSERPAGKADLSGKDQVGVSKLEGERSHTSDTLAGAAHGDVFKAGADDAGRGDASPGEAGSDDQIISEGEKPAGLLDAPQGAKDDLKRVKGIGPVIEGKLNDLGIFHFRQIAAWREPELVWIDNYLNFRGRALRERWIEQARMLQDGAPDGTQAS